MIYPDLRPEYSTKTFSQVYSSYEEFKKDYDDLITLVSGGVQPLTEDNVKATFFMVGTLMEANQGVARRIYEEGHLLANHSYSHKYSELYADTDSFMNQIDKAQEMIFKITDNPNYPKICRFPGGSHNAGTYGEIKQECKIKLEESGYRHCDWNALSGDAEKASPSADYIMSRLKQSVGNKEDVVILMHDALAKGVTAKTLPDVLDYLIECGYEFDTLDKA